jgi:hypothetical protein
VTDFIKTCSKKIAGWFKLTCPGSDRIHYPLTGLEVDAAAAGQIDT